MIESIMPGLEAGRAFTFKRRKYLFEDTARGVDSRFYTGLNISRTKISGLSKL